MRHYTQLTESERFVTQKMYYAGTSIRKIAQTLGRAPSTISNELKRNKTYGYNSKEAHEKSKNRRYIQPCKISTDGFLQMIIFDCLSEKDSPEVIAKYLKEYFPEHYVSHETIYKWLYLLDNPYRGKLLPLLYTKRRRRQKRSNMYKNRGVDPTKKNIRSRPKEAWERKVPGHLEGDLICGKGQSGYMLTLVDRATAYTWGLSIPSKDEETVLRAFVEVYETMPEGFIKTITLDNGKEFSMHKQIENSLQCNVYFADPYSSWQRGLNEHINGRIRHYLPKSRSFIDLDDEEVSYILHSINNRPRKSLKWCSPYEAILSLGVSLVA